MTALIDADIIAYRGGASAENDPLDIAYMRVDNMMMDILENEKTYLSFLSGKNNFRYSINPEYKANRKDKVKPKWLDKCKEYLISEYKSITTDGYEADDALGFNQTEETVIYTIDKDLMMIPGHHYNFVKKEYREVSEQEAIKTFYKQMLIGDSSDNIFGVEKIGKVKAEKIISPLETEEEMFNVVFSLYDTEERFWNNADCLWIWRIKEERFSDRQRLWLE